MLTELLELFIIKEPDFNLEKIESEPQSLKKKSSLLIDKTNSSHECLDLI